MHTNQYVMRILLRVQMTCWLTLNQMFINFLLNGQSKDIVTLKLNAKKVVFSVSCLRKNESIMTRLGIGDEYMNIFSLCHDFINLFCCSAIDATVDQKNKPSHLKYIWQTQFSNKFQIFLDSYFSFT